MVHRLYVAISPAPLLFLVLFLRYTGRLEGWGAWAAGPLVLPIIGLSALLGLYGVHLAVRADTVRWRTILTAAAFVAGSVAIWVAVGGVVRLF